MREMLSELCVLDSAFALRNSYATHAVYDHRHYLSSNTLGISFKQSVSYCVDEPLLIEKLQKTFYTLFICRQVYPLATTTLIDIEVFDQLNDLFDCIVVQDT